MRHILLIFLTLFIAENYFSQINNSLTIEDTNSKYNFLDPKEYEIGPIRIEGADNFDHQGIRLISGLRQGEKIKIPGEMISNAIKNLWKEEIFSDIQIHVEKELAGVVYFVIKVSPRPKLSRFLFRGVNRRDADKLREEIALFSGKRSLKILFFKPKTKYVAILEKKDFMAFK